MKASREENPGSRRQVPLGKVERVIHGHRACMEIEAYSTSARRRFPAAGRDPANVRMAASPCFPRSPAICSAVRMTETPWDEPIAPGAVLLRRAYACVRAPEVLGGRHRRSAAAAPFRHHWSRPAASGCPWR